MTPAAAQKALKEGERVEAQLTDPKAAEQLPHRDLARAQVLQLISEVFGTQIEGVAGVFNDLDVDHFLSDNAAIIDAGDQPEVSGVVVGEGDYDGPALLESTVPLRTEDQSGEQATVDLGLEHAEGEIQPATSLVEVGIPSELGEGIQLPESEVEIALAGAPEERAPSIVDQTVALYPEVAEDTAFAVAPSPTGVETFTLLQSPDAPSSATYRLSLPDGASLTAADDGGAEVSTGEQPTLRIFPPTAMDAEGNGVPVSLEVSGDSFTVHAEPGEGAVYPILVDPVVESHDWYGYQNPDGLAAWKGSSSAPGLDYNKQSALGYPGTDLRAVKGFTLPANALAQWAYSVPRYESDQKDFGTLPTSYISSMVLTNLFFVTNEDKSAYPWMAAGIWDPTIANWATAWAHPGDTGNLVNLATTYTFNTTNQNAKQAIDNVLWSGAAHTMTSDRETFVGYATVTIADPVAPKIGSFAPPGQWVNATAPAIPYSVTDSGLGVKEMTIAQAGGTNKWTFALTCSGNVSYPCPRSWKSGETYPTLPYQPSSLPQGINKMTVTAKDPTGNSSAPYEFSLKVDHTAPQIVLSGSMVPVNYVGYRPQYSLITESTDGTSASHQSGVASTEITIDGKKVDSTTAGCATQNCSVTREWILKSDEYAAGKHTVVVKATDGVGLKTERSFSIEIVRDKTAPTVYSTTGGLENAPSGWVEQKSYKLGVGAEDAGYGVTSLEFKMDGKVVKSTTAPCVKGGCALGMWEVAVNMAEYKGGAHTAEYIAKDGAGNVATKNWTVNVDPSGVVSAAEAVDTLEAMEETTEATAIAPTNELIDPQERADGNDPGLEEVEGGFQSTGTPLESLISSESSKGITLESSGGSIEVTEIGAASGSPPSIASEVASVDPNTSTQVDSVVRPIYDGDQSFKVIRDATAPTEYSWKLLLNTGQKLEQVDSQHVAVFWGNGDRAMAISAEQAHDATGKEVPTELTAEGSDVVTLTVKHTSASFVYPVLAGPAFKSSYTLPVIWEPPPPEPTEQEEAEAQMAGMSIPSWTVGAPIPSGPGSQNEATISTGLTAFHRTFKGPGCAPLGCGVWKEEIVGFFWYNGYEAWWKKTQPDPTCPGSGLPWYSYTVNLCDFVGPNHQKYGAGYHITAQMFFDVHTGVWTSSGKHVTVRMFGDGFYKPHDTDNICNPSRPEC